MKGILLTALSVALTTVAHADLKMNFEDIDTPDNIDKVKKVKGAVKIEIDSSKENNSFLRMNNPKASARFLTGIKKPGDLTFNFDWRSNGKSAGTLYSLSDYNPKKVFAKVTLVKGSVQASSFIGKKYRDRQLFKPEKDKWYRFNIKVSGDRYTLKVTDRGIKNNNDDPVIVYNSVAAKKRFKANAKITPYILSFNTWSKVSKTYYDYDNVVLKTK